MLRNRFTLAVLGTVLALGVAASDVEARHCRHQRHQHRACCTQVQHTGCSQSGCGYSGHNHQNCSQQMNSNACCGTDQWQQNGGYQNQMSSYQTNDGYGTTSAATATVPNAAPVAVNPPQPAVTQVEAPSPVN